MKYLLKKILIKNEEISYYIKENKAKFTIVFIHGYNSSSDFAQPLFNLPQNFNIVVLNLPGSLLLKNPRHVLSIDLFISIVKEFITKHVKVSNLILLGHSLSGGVVAPLSQHPKVKQIIYLSTIHPRMNHSNSWKNLNTFYNQTHKNSFFHDYLKNNPELEEIFDQEKLFADLTKKYLLNLEYVEKELKTHYLKSLNKKNLIYYWSKWLCHRNKTFYRLCCARFATINSYNSRCLS